MIGDKRYAEAAGPSGLRFAGAVGERCRSGKAVSQEMVKERRVRMQTRVAINQMRILVAVNPRFPGAGSSSQGQSGAKMRP